MKRVYLDTASATPLEPKVLAKMKPYLAKRIGNPASLHLEGRQAAEAVAFAREKIANSLGCRSTEIYFTSGGTEAVNWGIFGVARNFKQPQHLIVSAIEHEAVLAPVRMLVDWGWKVDFCPVNNFGLIEPKKIRELLRPETVLVAVMMVNNELGTIQPVREIAKEIRHWRKENNFSGPSFLVDACQAPRALKLNLASLGADLLALNGSKIYGPKGVGALYVRNGVKISSLLFGGGQEQGLRAGTLNVPGIVGLAEALDLCDKKRDKENQHLAFLRDWLKQELEKQFPDIIFNGSFLADERVASNLNFSLPGLSAEQLVIELDIAGWAISAGSACANLSDDESASHVLSAIGASAMVAKSALRLSLGREIKHSDLRRFVRSLKEIVERLRLIEGLF